ncbi:MAG TPA: glutamine--fructose-6-phosphate aminotransferase, partial [Chloroflexi bacterium]|nr:glutamine--fructose-6-phosphate aminotransferase [Chloroflexota bacterium]
MCGIVGYVGPRNATPIILDGLKRLEYRGYDSAGLAVVQDDGSIGVRREAGKLARLAEKIRTAPVSGHVGIGHTRWATHGEPCERNAHPHLGPKGEVTVVHNGIIENFRALREELEARGHVFASDTDTEVAVHLVEDQLAGGVALETAVRQALKRVKGANAFLFLSRRHPDRIIAARVGNAGGLTVGLGEGENFIASDIPAILEHTRQMVFLEDRQLAIVTQDTVWLETLEESKPIAIEAHTIPWDPVSAAKEPYRHFMQKEI